MNKLFKSFGFAIKGIAFALKEQQNLRIHLAGVVTVTVAGIILHLSIIEWAVITLTCGLVIVAELVNTAIEDLVNMVSPGHHHLAGKIKDIAAGAVLIAAITAVVVGAFILGSKLYYRMV